MTIPLQGVDFDGLGCHGSVELVVKGVTRSSSDWFPEKFRSFQKKFEFIER
jgi:hypothetical protein